MSAEGECFAKSVFLPIKFAASCRRTLVWEKSCTLSMIHYIFYGSHSSFLQFVYLLLQAPGIFSSVNLKLEIQNVSTDVLLVIFNKIPFHICPSAWVERCLRLVDPWVD